MAISSGPGEKSQRLLSEDRATARDERLFGNRFGIAAAKADRQALVVGERFHGVEPELPDRENVVAELRMAVERQVIGEEVHAGLEQRSHPGVGVSGELPWPALPEQPMMNQDGVRAAIAGALEELDAGRDAGRDPADRAAPLDLDAVRTVVLASAGLEQRLEMLRELGDR